MAQTHAAHVHCMSPFQKPDHLLINLLINLKQAKIKENLQHLLIKIKYSLIIFLHFSIFTKLKSVHACIFNYLSEYKLIKYGVIINLHEIHIDVQFLCTTFLETNDL